MLMRRGPGRSTMKWTKLTSLFYLLHTTLTLCLIQSSPSTAAASHTTTQSTSSSAVDITLEDCGGWTDSERRFRERHGISGRHEVGADFNFGSLLGDSTFSRSLLQNKNKGVECSLSQEEMSSMLNEPLRTWVVDDAVLGRHDHDVQSLIDCTQEGDSVFFQPSSHIKPSRRVKIPWRLTLDTAAENTSVGNEATVEERAVFSCGRNRGLFDVRSKSVTFRNMIITNCTLDIDGDAALVEVGECEAESEMGHIIFERVTFRDHHLIQTSALLATNASCTSIQMTDVDFVNNTCSSGTCFAHLSLNNELNSMRMEDNRRSADLHLTHTLISLPANSSTMASDVTANRNAMTVLSTRNAQSLRLVDSRFLENAKGSVMVLQTVAEVRLSNCSFDGNSADSGGALVATGGVVHVENCLFQNSRVDRNGGAMDVTAGSVQILSSTFHNNTAGMSGGAIHTVGTDIDITNSTMQQNSAFIRGGAIALTDGASLQLQASEFYGNRAVMAGGALVISKSEGHIRQCTFEQNRAIDGGAIDAQGPSYLRIYRSIFAENHATENGGGGLHLALECVMELSDTHFKENIAGRHGGSISASWSRLTVWNVTIDGGSCEQVGGGIRVVESSHLSLSHSTLSHHRANYGGCLSSKHTTVDINDVTFRNCSAVYYGGAFNVDEKSTVQLNATRIMGSRALQRGGGIRCRNASVVAHHLLLKHNVATQYGGGLFASQESDVTLLSARIIGNRCDGYGGGIATRSRTHIELKRVTLRNNSVPWQGGGLNVDMSFARIVRSRFLENVAKEGGSLVVKESEVVVSKTSFHRDMAERGGSINSLWMGHLTFNDVSILSSNASLGSGLYLTRSNVTAKELRVVRNRAMEDGGGVYAGDSSVILCTACTFEENVAGFRGGAVTLNASDAQMLAYQFEQSHFIRNRAGLGGAIFFLSRHLEEDCSRPGANCTFAALIATQLSNNTASAGAALFVSDPNTLRYQCNETTQRKDLELRSMDDFQQMKLVDSMSGCPQWDGNIVDHFGPLVASFARSVHPFVKHDKTSLFKKWNSTVLRIGHHKSGDTLPSIRLQVVDGFGQGPATGTGNASVEAVMWSNEHFFTGNISVFLDEGEAEISGVAGFQPPGVYRVNIDFSEDVLPRLTIVIAVRDCAFGESRQGNGTFCSPCSESQFNFDPDQDCQACPDNADCSAGSAIQPKPGYWHGDPCSQQIQQCPVEESCAFVNRTEDLSALTEGLDTCELNETLVEHYRATQCREGYRDVLCGSCADTHGRTRSLECAECHRQPINVLMYVLSLVLLLFLSSFAIKSNLTCHRSTIPVVPRSRLRSFRRRPNRSARYIEMNETRRQSNAEIHVEADNHLHRQQADGESAQQRAEKFKQQITEIFKIAINFLQVIAVAVSVNVHWTRHMISLFSAADIIGNGAASGLSLPIDCFLPSETTIPRSVLRTVVFMAIPAQIVTFFVLFWTAATFKYGQTWMYFARRILLSYLAVIYLAYVTITKTAVNTLFCIRIYASNNEVLRYWTMDTSVTCYETSHAALIGALALPALLIVSIGFPVTLAIVLTRVRHSEPSTHSWLSETTGFLYRAYNEKLSFWESIVMLRKSLLAAIVASGWVVDGNIQGVMAVCVLTIALYIHTLFQPFKNEFGPLNIYEGASLVTSQLTFVSGILFNSDRVEESVRILLTVSLGLMICSLSSFFLFKLIGAIVCYSYAFLEVEEIEIPETWGPLRVFCKFLSVKCSGSFSYVTQRLSVIRKRSSATVGTV